MSRIEIERREIRGFSGSVAAEAARNLELLGAIESTLAWLTRLTSTLKVDIAFGTQLAEDIGNLTEVVDPDNSLEAAMLEAQQSVESLYDLLIAKREAGRRDRQLTEDDGIEAAYTEAIAAAADLHNLLNSLRWQIGEHDIDATPHEVREENLYSDPDALLDSLLSLRK
ncbi:hypothetical protein [Sterolibacterium denitrificans]|nr:hypothetical protein [Sterolibacterium denitrificans]